MPDTSLPALEQVLIRTELDRPWFHAGEVRRLPEPTWRDILASGLLREAEVAGWATCDCAWDVHDEEVRYAPPESAWAGRPYISCPEAGVRWVEPDELRQWVIDLDQLATALGAALACSGRVEELVPGRLWLLGRTPLGGRTRDVFLARGAAEPRGAVGVIEACPRARAAAAPVVLVPEVVPRLEAQGPDAPTVLPLTSVAALSGRKITIDRDYLEDACRGESAPPVAATPIPPPGPGFTPAPGVTWSDVEIRFSDVHTVAVRVGEARGVFHYAQMGMADGRSSMPTEQWKLLHTFATAPGNVLDWTSREARRRNKKRCEYLVADLRRFFGIEGGAPIEYSRRDKGWRPLFRLFA